MCWEVERVFKTLIYRHLLSRETAGSNENLKVEQPRAWECPDSPCFVGCPVKLLPRRVVFVGDTP